MQTGGHTFSGCLIGDEIPVNTLYPADLDDARRVLRLALKTTRDRRFDEVRKALLRSKQVKTKAGKPARNLSTVRQNAEYEGMSPTTTFDFLYRLRIRSNYRDSAHLSRAERRGHHRLLRGIGRACDIDAPRCRVSCRYGLGREVV